MLETDSEYLGMVQEGVEVCDVVCLFYGGQTLYIVREVKEYQNRGSISTSGHEYALVGNCYVGVDGW